MRRLSRKTWLIGAALAICLIGVVLVMLDAPRRYRQAHLEVRTRVDIQNYTAALAAFSNSFGGLPMGNNAEVTSALIGRNARNFTFLHLTPQQTNGRGEFIDRTRRPYEITVAAEEVWIARRTE
jgi:hypothetical protein